MWHQLSTDDERRCEKLLGWERIASNWSEPNGDEKIEARFRSLPMPELARVLVVICIAAGLHVADHTSNKESAPRL